MIPFVDIASYQEGPAGIDWPTVAKYLTGIHPEAGVIVKTSESVDYVNPFLHQQRQGAHAAGIRSVGLYHFGRPSRNSGHSEADYFLKAIGDDGGILAGEFVCLDIEDTDVAANADLDAYVLDFAGRVIRPLGVPIVVYTGSWYAEPHNLNRDPQLAKLGLWWANVGANIPPTPEPWRSAGKNILLWQYDWYGRIPGITGDVDLDWLVGGIETLRGYQWGFQVDPLAGKLVAGKPDVPVNDKGEAIDSGRTFQKIAANLATARGMGSRGTALDNLLAVTQGDAAAGALVSGLLG